MQVKVPEGYGITYAGTRETARAAFITDPWGIEFGHLSGPDGWRGFTYLRHYVTGDKTTHRVTGYTSAQAALDDLIARHTADPCKCGDCVKARANNAALPNRVATVYHFTTGESGTGPFAVHYGGSGVLHVLYAEGQPLTAVKVDTSTDNGAEMAAREWGAAQRGDGLEVEYITGPSTYQVSGKCIDCHREPEDGQGVMAFESRLWEGWLPTSFTRCFACNAKEAQRKRTAVLDAYLIEITGSEHKLRTREGALAAAVKRDESGQCLITKGYGDDVPEERRRLFSLWEEALSVAASGQFSPEEIRRLNTIEGQETDGEGQGE